HWCPSWRRDKTAAQGRSGRARPHHSASHALRCHMSQGLRGRSVPSTPRQPSLPVNRGSPTAATPSTTLLTLSTTLLPLLQKALASRGSSLGASRSVWCRHVGL